MYLYVNADGTAQQSSHAPDDADLDQIENDDLLVFEYRLGEFYQAVVSSEEGETEDEKGTLSLDWTKVDRA